MQLWIVSLLNSRKEVILHIKMGYDMGIDGGHGIIINTNLPSFGYLRWPRLRLLNIQTMRLRSPGILLNEN